MLQEVLDLLLASQTLGGVGRSFGVEAEQYGVAVGEEIPDRLVRAQRHMLALVILEDQVEPRGPPIKPQVQIGLGQRTDRGLARLDLRDLFGQILGGPRVGRRQPKARDLPARRLPVEDGQQRRLAHIAMTEQRDPHRPRQPGLQLIQSIGPAVAHPVPREDREH